jgi:MoxR-like ATPase
MPGENRSAPMPPISTQAEREPRAGMRAGIAERVVGRRVELELLFAAVASGRDILLEGPPGTSKTTMLGAITAEWGIPLVLVEGNSELTAARLIGHHLPARVLQEGYTEDNFVPGPLVRAMREGAFLYIEEFNRAPEDALNTLLMAMAERRMVVPRVGSVDAAPSFRLIASMNPYDNVGTTRVSASVHDRFCRLAVGYQDAVAEREIVALRTGPHDGEAFAAQLVADAVTVTRATRTHGDLRFGSSIRGSVDIVFIGLELGRLRGTEAEVGDGYARLLLDAMIVALSGRVQVHEASGRSPEDVLREIWTEFFASRSKAAAPG